MTSGTPGSLRTSTQLICSRPCSWVSVLSFLTVECQFIFPYSLVDFSLRQAAWIGQQMIINLGIALISKSLLGNSWEIAPKRASGPLQTSKLTLSSCHLIFQDHILFIIWPQLLANLGPPAFPSPEPLTVIFAAFHYVIQTCDCKAPKGKGMWICKIFICKQLNELSWIKGQADIKVIKLQNEISWFINFLILIIVLNNFS